jgi:hypothetical protein
MNRYEFERTLHEKGLVIHMKGTFAITLTVDPPSAPPLAVASPEDIGPSGTALPAGSKLAITGGTPPYVLSALAGTPPPGVTINSDGSLSGTPTAPGSYNVSFDLADANG